jgi:hypothetical protein
VSYIFYGPAEQALGGYAIGDSTLVQQVFSTPLAKVYKVRLKAEG